MSFNIGPKGIMSPVYLSSTLASVFTTSQTAKLTGVTSRMLSHWDRIGLIHPTARRAHGKGTKRLYTFSDLIVIRMILQLRLANCPLGKIHGAVKELRRRRPEHCSSVSLAELTLLTNGKSVFIVESNEKLLDVVTRQVVWCVPLGQLIIETSQLVSETKIEWKEFVDIGGRRFQLLVHREVGEEHFVASCCAIRGVIRRSKNPKDAIGRMKDAIAEVLKFESTLRQNVTKGQSQHKGITA